MTLHFVVCFSNWCKNDDTDIFSGFLFIFTRTLFLLLEFCKEFLLSSCLHNLSKILLVLNTINFETINILTKYYEVFCVKELT